MNGITRIIVLAFLALLCIPVNAQEYKQVNDISYTLKTDAYSQQRLKLDVYHPEGATGFTSNFWRDAFAWARALASEVAILL